jgi:hypothetical protein
MLVQPALDHPPALQAGFYCGYYGTERKITSLARQGCSMIRFRSALSGIAKPKTDAKALLAVKAKKALAYFAE